MKSDIGVIRISQVLDERLTALAAKTRRSKSYHASKAIAIFLEDMEDCLAAREALKNSKKSYTLDEPARGLGLDRREPGIRKSAQQIKSPKAC